MHGFLLKKWRWLLTILVLAVIGGGLCWWQRAQAAQQFVQSKTPTFFFHGYGSSHHAEEHMANAAKRAGATNTIIWANVDRTGKDKNTGLCQIERSSIQPDTCPVLEG